MHACGGARNRRQEGDVLIVSVLVAIVVNLALRSNAQGRIKVPGVRQLPILVGLGASAIAVVGNPEIEDEVPRPSRVLEVVDNLDVAALSVALSVAQGHSARPRTVCAPCDQQYGRAVQESIPSRRHGRRASLAD